MFWRGGGGPNCCPGLGFLISMWFQCCSKVQNS
jgi:hypothetical protein